MKTMTIEQFEALVNRGDWVRSQELETVERLARYEEQYNDEADELEQIEIPHAWGWAAKTSVLDGVTIVYQEGFNYDECQPDSLSTGTEGQGDVWKVEGVSVVDEDGDELNAHDLADYLPGVFSEISYNGLNIGQTIDIDVDEGSNMDTITLEIDNAPDVRFTGEQLAAVSSSDDQALGSSYSGQAGRWTELALYRTKGGKYICHQVGRTRWQGERDRFSGKVCESLDEVREFFGHRWLAKELYEAAGVDDVQEVE